MISRPQELHRRRLTFFLPVVPTHPPRFPSPLATFLSLALLSPSEQYGGKVTGAVSSRTHFLLLGTVLDDGRPPEEGRCEELAWGAKGARWG